MSSRRRANGSAPRPGLPATPRPLPALAALSGLTWPARLLANVSRWRRPRELLVTVRLIPQAGPGVFHVRVHEAPHDPPRVGDLFALELDPEGEGIFLAGTVTAAGARGEDLVLVVRGQTCRPGEPVRAPRT